MPKVEAGFFTFFFLNLLLIIVLQVISVLAGFSLSAWALGQMYEVRGHRAVPDELILVLLTDHCIKELELSRRTPVPVEIFENTAEKILQEGGSPIFFDPSFFPVESSRNDFLKTFKDKPVFFLADMSGSESSPLQTLIQAIKKAPSKEIYPPQGNAFINFYGPPATVPAIPLSAVIGQTDGSLSEIFKNKIIFFGLASLSYQSGQRDSNQLVVPSSNERMFEVEFQATLLGNLLDKSWIRELPLTFAIGAVVATAILVIVIALNFSFNITAIVLLSLCFLILFGGYFLFTRLFLWTAFLPLLIIIPLFTLFLKRVWKLPKKTREYSELKDRFSINR